MMKLYLRQMLLLLPLLAVLAGCNRIEVTDESIQIDIAYERATGVLYRVSPQSYDYYYVCDAVSVEDYNRMGEREVIDSLNAMYKDLYDVIKDIYEEMWGEDAPSFHDMLNNGTMDGDIVSLRPETKYYLCVMCYNRRNHPVKTIVKKPFTTKDSLASDITFDVESVGTRIKITPSNNDKYYWLTDKKDDVDSRYYGFTSLFYEDMVSGLERYGTIDTLLVQGVQSKDMMKGNTIHVQDTLYLMAAGYHNETNSKVETFELVYQGDNGFSVRRVEDTWTLSDEDAETQAAYRKLLGKKHITPRLKR